MPGWGDWKGGVEDVVGGEVAKCKKMERSVFCRREFAGVDLSLRGGGCIQGLLEYEFPRRSQGGPSLVGIGLLYTES